MKEDISKIFLSRLFELNPIEKVSKLMKSLSDFHDVTFNFLKPEVTDTGTVVTLVVTDFSISSGKKSLLLETIEGRSIKDYYFLYRLFKLQLKQVCLINDDVTYGVMSMFCIFRVLSDCIYFSCLKFTGTEKIVKLGDCDVTSAIAEQL